MKNLNKDFSKLDLDDDFIDSQLPWDIIKTYFDGKHLQQLVRHQLESYNNFITSEIPRTIEMFNPVSITSEQDYDKDTKLYKLEILITFENLNIHRPQIHENNGATKLMFPQEARLRNFTYSSTMTVDINIKMSKRINHKYKLSECSEESGKSVLNALNLALDLAKENKIDDNGTMLDESQLLEE